MLKIALPNKGVLADPANQLFTEAGYRLRRQDKELYIPDVKNDVEFFFLRPRDIATYVGSGALDVGITGRDLLMDSVSQAQEIVDLGFGKSTFHFAAPQSSNMTKLEDLQNKRIGTSYARLVERYLEERSIDATIVKLDGAVENSVRLGVADAVADVVETGATLRAAGLEIFGDSLLSSTACLLISPQLAASSNGQLAILRRRIEGVLVARSYVLLDYDIPLKLLEEATKHTPGLKSPTVSPLKDEAWVAVRAMVPSQEINQVMDELDVLGAQGILVTDIKSARL